MAKISTYPRDGQLTHEDKVIGSNAGDDKTLNFYLQNISSFTRGNIVSRTTEGDVLVAHNNDILGSYITNNITSSSTISSTVTGEREVTIGSSARAGFFALNDIIVVGRRIIFHNMESNETFIGTISSFDINNGTIQVRETISNTLSGASTTSGANNLLTVYRNDGISINGDLTVFGTTNFAGPTVAGVSSITAGTGLRVDRQTGAITATVETLENTNTNVGAIQPTGYWFGTESQFQLLASQPDFDVNIIYDTIDG